MREILAYIAGLVASDGSLSRKDYRVKIVTSNKQFAGKIKRFIEKLGFNSSIYAYSKGGRRKYEVYTYSKKLWMTLVREFGINPGKKAKSITIPNGLTMEEKKQYIRGLFDGDSTIYVTKVRLKRKDTVYIYYLPRIVYKTQSRMLCRKLREALKELNISTYTYHDLSSNTCAVVIDGFEKIRRFAELIGYAHPCKKRRLEKILSKYSHEKPYYYIHSS